MFQDDVTLVVPCTGEDCRNIGPRFAKMTCRVHIVRNKRYGEALREGIRAAHTPYVATMDADGQHNELDIYRLYEEIVRNDAAMVIGKRADGQEGVRHVASRFLNFAASVLAGQRVPDFGSGLRIFQRRDALRFMPRLPLGFDFNATLTMAFLLDGLSVLWVPITVRLRQHGKSHVRWHDGVLTLHSLCRVRYGRQ